MTQIFTPWVYGLRRLALRAPAGPRTDPTPVPPPPGLEPPPTVPAAENGYLRLVRAVDGWPEEGPFPPDLVHWRKALPNERRAAEAALAPLRPYLEGLDAALNAPCWQAPISEDGAFPELARMKRLAQALLLRGALDDRPEDRDRAIELARRLRRSQGPLMHFLVGLAVERQAGGPLEGLEEDRAEAARWELAHYAIPRASRSGPWEPLERPWPAEWNDARLAVAWALSGHPRSYDPAATVAALVAERGLLAGGSAADIQARAESYGTPWPGAMFAPGTFGPGRASLAELRRARAALREVDNPYGRLTIAQTLRATANLADAAEKAKKA